MRAHFWTSLSLVCALAGAVALAPAHEVAGAGSAGCAALGTYYLRHHGPMPLALRQPAATSVRQSIPITFPGLWGTGMLRLSAYTGCAAPVGTTQGSFAVGRYYGPPVERGGTSPGSTRAQMPVPLGGLHEISGTIVQSTASPHDASAVVLSGTLQMGAWPCASVCPANTKSSYLMRLTFGPVPGRLLWSAQAPGKITLAFSLDVRQGGHTTRYAVRFTGIK